MRHIGIYKNASSAQMLTLIRKVALYILALGLGCVFVLPFFWLVSTAVKPPEQIFLMPPKWIPDPIKLGNFIESWTTLPFTLYLKNTLVITISAMIGQILTASMAAYAFAFLKWPGRNVWFMIVLTTVMMPWMAILIPQFILFRYLGWIDTFKPLIIPLWLGGGAFYIFILRQFYLTIPREIVDAAKMDGCYHWRIWWQMIMPLSKPALATVAIFSFMSHWNNFLGPLIYLNSEEKRTLTLGLQAFQLQHDVNWSGTMAVSTLMILPVIVLFFFAQKYFIHGITMSGIKG